MRLGIRAVRIGGRNVFKPARSRLETASEEYEGKSAENHAAARVERKALRYIPRLVMGTPKALHSAFRGVKGTVKFTAKQAQTFKRKQAIRQRVKQRGGIRARTSANGLRQRQATMRRYLKQSRRMVSGRTTAQRIRTRALSLAGRGIKRGGKIAFRKGKAAVTAKAAQAVRTKQREAEKRNAENYATARVERAAMKAAPKAVKFTAKALRLAAKTVWTIPRRACRLWQKQRAVTGVAKQDAFSQKAQTSSSRIPKVSNPLSVSTQRGVSGTEITRRGIPANQRTNAPKHRKIHAKREQTAFRASGIRGKSNTFRTRTAGQTVTATPEKNMATRQRKNAAIRKAKKEAGGQVGSRAAQQAKTLAKRAARRGAQMVKDLVKAAATAVKALIAAIGGGAFLIALIVLIAGAAFIFASPWGIFYGADDPGSHPIPQVVADINAEFQAQVQAGASGSADAEYDIEGDSLVPNWIDVLAVFAVKTTTNMSNPLDVGTMDDEKVAILKQVFYDMNEIAATQTIVTETAADGTQTTKTITTVTVKSKTWHDMIAFYGFNAEQEKLLRELMSGEYYGMFVELLGMAPARAEPLTPEEWAALEQSLPPGSNTGEIVKKAFERLGDPYSRGLRGQGNYLDCSYFTRWVYRAFGLELPGTAAEQARWCVDNGVTVSYNDLQPGDLVFFSSDGNGRYMNVDHVGIYVGNGKIIDASASRGKVVYRDIWTNTLVLCGRPSLNF